MKEINIAKIIIKKRKEKGITQNDLANHLGVSKASVSKWETGQSYPDITFIPILAAYFNISIDELMSYEPQLTKEEIRNLYHKLATDFANKPFDEVMNQCRGIIKKYYSCFPLLFQMGALILNHSTLPNDTAKTTSIMMEVKELFIRVKNESDDVELIKQARNLEAYCLIVLGNPDEVITLLIGTSAQAVSTEPLVASAYQMMGKDKEAKTVLQIGAYQYIVALFGCFPSYLMLYTKDLERFEEIYHRIGLIAEVFHIKELHPSLLMNIYLSAAQGYSANEKENKALDALEEYTELVTGDIYPLNLKGDDFFNLIDDWLAEFDLPRDERTIRQSMLEAVANDPTYTVLANEPRFHKILERLKNNC